jgi:ATP dependent DNA ligase domain
MNTHGKMTEWTIHVRAIAPGNETKQGAELEAAFLPLEPELDNKPSANYGWCIVYSGVVGGKIRDTVPTITREGKSQKSSAATNPFCQALRDALGLYNKKCRKVAVEVVAEAGADAQAHVRPLPMLAQVAKMDGLDWTRPMWVQRKFNGVRAVAVLEDNAVVMYSRSGIAYPGFDKIKAELLPVLQEYPSGVHLDGEIYKHGKTLNEISGQARGGTAEDVEYMAYDMFDSDKPKMLYTERRRELNDLLACVEGVYVKPVETYDAVSEANVNMLYTRFRAEGYEGAMLRLEDVYKYSYNGHHCKQLLKIKPTYDDEYEIVGWTVGRKGKAAAALMLKCTIGDVERRNIVDESKPVDPQRIAPEKRIFDVTPMGEIADRDALAVKMAEIQPSMKTYFEENWLGRKITIYFAELSPYGVPQQGRTKMEVRVD